MWVAVGKVLCASLCHKDCLDYKGCTGVSREANSEMELCAQKSLFGEISLRGKINYHRIVLSWGKETGHGCSCTKVVILGMGYPQGGG